MQARTRQINLDALMRQRKSTRQRKKLLPRLGARENEPMLINTPLLARTLPANLNARNLGAAPEQRENERVSE